MSGIDYNELFGLTEGANEQEVAEPAAEENEGANEQEVADPAVEDADAGAVIGAEEYEEENQDSAPAQSKEERARHAAARRKAEADAHAAELERVRQEAQSKANEEFDKAFAGSGLINPYTKKPISSRAEFDEYRQRYEVEKKNTFMRQTGMGEEEYQRFVAELPEVQEARQTQQEAAEATRQAQLAQARAHAEQQLQEISRMDPSIKTMEDLTKMENYPRFYELVKRGNDLVDAFRLANFDKLTQSAAAASRQSAINAARSKEHLNPTGSRGAGAVEVPPEVMEQYRMYNPSATEAEIRAHYQKYKK